MNMQNNYDNNTNNNNMRRLVTYMRSLLGWLETRLAQNASNYLNIA